jgi:hypothetical protein
MKGLLHRIFQFCKDRAGGSLIEFALLFPALLVLFLGFNEVARAGRAYQHLEAYTNTAAYDIAGILAYDKDANALNVTGEHLREMIERFFLIAPGFSRTGVQAFGGTSATARIGISMVRMVQRPGLSISMGNYAFTPRVVWTFGTDPVAMRKCGDLRVIDMMSGWTLATIPIGVVQSGAMIIVDATAKYNSIFGTPYLRNREFKSVGYFPVRNWRQFDASTGVATYPRWLGDTAGGYTGTVCPLI